MRCSQSWFAIVDEAERLLSPRTYCPKFCARGDWKDVCQWTDEGRLLGWTHKPYSLSALAMGLPKGTPDIVTKAASRTRKTLFPHFCSTRGLGVWPLQFSYVDFVRTVISLRANECDEAPP